MAPVGLNAALLEIVMKASFYWFFAASIVLILAWNYTQSPIDLEQSSRRESLAVKTPAPLPPQYSLQPEAKKLLVTRRIPKQIKAVSNETGRHEDTVSAASKDILERAKPVAKVRVHTERVAFKADECNTEACQKSQDGYLLAGVVHRIGGSKSASNAALQRGNAKRTPIYYFESR